VDLRIGEADGRARLEAGVSHMLARPSWKTQDPASDVSSCGRCSCSTRGRPRGHAREVLGRRGRLIAPTRPTCEAQFAAGI
jgi:hypothetical protein